MAAGEISEAILINYLRTTSLYQIINHWAIKKQTYKRKANSLFLLLASEQQADETIYAFYLVI